MLNAEIPEHHANLHFVREPLEPIWPLTVALIVSGTLSIVFFVITIIIWP